MPDTPDTQKAKTLAERLADAQSRRAAAQKTAEELEALKEVEAEECAADLEEKHGAAKVAKVATESGPFVLLRPPGHAWDARQRAVARAGKNDVAQKDIERFLYPAIQYPKNYQEVLEEQPATHVTLVVALARLFGAKAAEDLGK